MRKRDLQLMYEAEVRWSASKDRRIKKLSKKFGDSEREKCFSLEMLATRLGIAENYMCEDDWGNRRFDYELLMEDLKADRAAESLNAEAQARFARSLPRVTEDNEMRAAK